MSNEKPPDRAGKFEQTMITCPKCDGAKTVEYPGGKRAVTCPTCKGKGQIAG